MRYEDGFNYHPISNIKIIFCIRLSFLDSKAPGAAMGFHKMVAQAMVPFEEVAVLAMPEAEVELVVAGQQLVLVVVGARWRYPCRCRLRHASGVEYYSVDSSFRYSSDDENTCPFAFSDSEALSTLRCH